MKKYHRLVCLIITCLLICSVTVPALAAAKATYPSTQAFIKILDAEGIKYSFTTMNDSDDEIIRITYDGDSFKGLVFTFVFSSDGEDVAIRVWNIVQVDSSKKNKAFSVINEINKEYRWLKFVLDESDMTIQAEDDQTFRKNDVGEICYELLMRAIKIVDETYPKLKTVTK